MAQPDKKRRHSLGALVGALIAATVVGTGVVADEAALSSELQQKILLRKYDEALPQLQTLATAGDLEARYQLALFYINGTGVERSVSSATNLLRQASQGGHAKAGYLLGTMYYRGRDVPQDTKQAKFYLFAASQQGHRLAGRLLKEIDSGGGGAVERDDRAQERLMLAARTGEQARGELAIRQGARVNLADENGEAPLVTAIRNRREDFAIWLLDIGADTDTHDASGNTVLLLSVRAGLSELAQRLVSDGVDVDTTTAEGRTALMEAVTRQDPDLVALLLKSGASPDAMDKQGRSARELATLRDSTKIKSLFAAYRLRRGTADANDERLALLHRQTSEEGNLYFGWPLLAAAVAQREDRVARELLSSGSDPWERTPNDTNAIAVAINNGDESLAGLMMHSQGIGTPEQEDESLSLLAMAAATDRLSVVRDLVTMIPPQSNTRRPLADTALWMAIDKGHADVALTLTSWQSPDKRIDERGRNLLLLASERGLSPVVAALLRQGFEIGAIDNAGRSPAWHAAENGHCRLLLSLADNGASLDQSDYSGHTPLIRAVIARHQECVAIAIAARADVDHQTRNGNTALIMAAQGQPQILRLILDADADSSIRNEASMTALMTAVRERCIECASFLLRAGANPRRQNAQGKNCFDMAEGDEAMLAALEN
jgi:ankyrin repeat protein